MSCYLCVVVITVCFTTDLEPPELSQAPGCVDAKVKLRPAKGFDCDQTILDIGYFFGAIISFPIEGEEHPPSLKWPPMP